MREYCSVTFLKTDVLKTYENKKFFIFGIFDVINQFKWLHCFLYENKDEYRFGFVEHQTTRSDKWNSSQTINENMKKTTSCKIKRCVKYNKKKDLFEYVRNGEMIFELGSQFPSLGFVSQSNLKEYTKTAVKKIIDETIAEEFFNKEKESNDLDDYTYELDI